jgi:hypothetical protein
VPLVNCDANDALELLTHRDLLPGLKTMMVHQMRCAAAFDSAWALGVAVSLHVDVPWAEKRGPPRCTTSTRTICSCSFAAPRDVDLGLPRVHARHRSTLVPSRIHLHPRMLRVLVSVSTRPSRSASTPAPL